MANSINLGPKAKMWVAAAGTTVTAVASAFAAVELVVEDGAIDFSEIGTTAGTLVAVFLTIYGVWKADNGPSQSQPPTPEV